MKPQKKRYGVVLATRGIAPLVIMNLTETNDFSVAVKKACDFSLRVKNNQFCVIIATFDNYGFIDKIMYEA